MNAGTRYAPGLRPLALMVVAACSSAGGGATSPDAATNDEAHDASVRNDDASTSSAPEGGRDAMVAAAEDAPADSSSSDGATVPVVDASAACTSYCACMATNCPGEVFTGGCLYQCAVQTNWDLPCRSTMCELVQAQPNNDHCTHAFGMVQCLDE